MPQMKRACVRAHSNIALIKYWGKRDSGPLNLPAVGSISVTLDALHTTTEVELLEGPKLQEIQLYDPSGELPQGKAHARMNDFLGRMATAAGYAGGYRIRSYNNFPTGAGFASSASGFAALVSSLAQALGLCWESAELSRWARMGSGSAARSLFGGYAYWRRGTRDDGLDSFAEGLFEPSHWPLCVVAAATESGPKSVGSTEGMTRSQQTSPYYDAFVVGQDVDLAQAQSAIATRDFDALAALTEQSCLKMHSVMFSSKPPLVYWRGATLEGLLAIQQMRAQGVPVCFTSDAGPQIKALCAPEVAPKVEAVLRTISGVRATCISALGPGPTSLDPMCGFDDALTQLSTSQPFLPVDQIARSTQDKAGP